MVGENEKFLGAAMLGLGLNQRLQGEHLRVMAKGWQRLCATGSSAGSGLLNHGKQKATATASHGIQSMLSGMESSPPDSDAFGSGAGGSRNGGRERHVGIDCGQSQGFASQQWGGRGTTDGDEFAQGSALRTLTFDGWMIVCEAACTVTN